MTLSQLRRRCRVNNDGFTVIELLVSMLLLTAVLGVFTASFINVETGVRKSTNLSGAQLQARNAFQLLDREVRYANALNDVATANGSQYVEFQLGDISPTVTIPQTCYQWRVTPASQLQWRSFTIPSPSAAAGTQSPVSPAWRTVATTVDTSAGPVFATDPTSSSFSALEPSANGANRRQLAVILRVVDGGHPVGRASTQALFTASNTGSSVAPATPVCQQAGRP